LPFDARKVARSLSSKGFLKVENDHTFFHLYVDGRDAGVFTKRSHGEREIGTPLAKRMQHQLKLESLASFRDLVECPLTYEEYVKQLRKAGVID
jgi:hypothetical protein